MANFWLSYNGATLGKNGYGVRITSEPPPITSGGIRFRFSDPTYDPTQESWGLYPNTWTRVTAMEGNVWDHTGNVLVNKYANKFQNASNLVEVLSTNHAFGTSSYSGFFDGIFSGCTALVYADFSNESRPCTVSSFFYGCSRLREVKFAPMTSFASTFRECTSLESVDFTAQTTGCTSFSRTFDGCVRLTNVSSNLYTGSATTISSMFNGCSALVSLPGISCASCTDASSAFSDCSSLTSVNLSNTGSLSNCQYMFSGCTSLLQAPDISLANAASCDHMFSGCSSITTAPAYNTDSATDMSHMFHGCGSLTAVPLIKTASATNVTEMFRLCTHVESGALALYNQMSSQTNPPTAYSRCFKHCGSSTVPGSAELAKIPTSWGGTMS